MAFCVQEASKFFVDLMHSELRVRYASSALGCALIISCVVDLGVPVLLAISHTLNGFRVLRDLRVIMKYL